MPPAGCDICIPKCSAVAWCVPAVAFLWWGWGFKEPLSEITGKLVGRLSPSFLICKFREDPSPPHVVLLSNWLINLLTTRAGTDHGSLSTNLLWNPWISKNSTDCQRAMFLRVEIFLAGRYVVFIYHPKSKFSCANSNNFKNKMPFAGVLGDCSRFYFVEILLRWGEAWFSYLFNLFVWGVLPDPLAKMYLSLYWWVLIVVSGRLFFLRLSQALCM